MITKETGLEDYSDENLLDNILEEDVREILIRMSCELKSLKERIKALESSTEFYKDIDFEAQDIGL